MAFIMSEILSLEFFSLKYEHEVSGRCIQLSIGYNKLLNFINVKYISYYPFPETKQSKVN